MNPRGLIGRLNGSNRPDTDFDPVQLFAAIHSGPVSPEELISTYSVARSTIYRTLNPFVEAGLVERTMGGFRLTGAGKVLFHAYKRASQIIDTDLLAFLIGSPNRPAVLHRISTRPARKAELAVDEKLPSRSTVQRILDECDGYGLITRNDDGAYALTAFGTEVLVAFERLVVAAEQSVEKAAFFNQFGDAATDLSPQRFLNAELVTVTASDPYALVDRTAELLEKCENSHSRVRVLSPVFSPYIFRLYRALLGTDTAIEAVIPETALTEARQRWNLEHFLGSLGNLSIDLRLSPERIPYGITLLDDRLILIGYDDPNRNEVALITDDERLVEWANEQFHRYWDEGKPPSEQLKRRTTGHLND